MERTAIPGRLIFLRSLVRALRRPGPTGDRPLGSGEAAGADAPPAGGSGWRLVTVSALHDEGPHAKTIVFDVPDWPGHVAGQHVDMRLTAEDGYQAQRSYSIASAPETPGVAITVDRIPDGEVSPFMNDVLVVGDQIELRGPFGGYFIWRAEEGGPLLLIAGGSGLVPLMSMLRHRQATARTVETRLLLSARTPDDVLYPAELLDLATEDGVAIVQTFTRAAPDGWEGFTRRIDREMLRAVWPDPGTRPRVYICGPALFVEHAAELLVRLGHAPEMIRTERFGPTG